MEFDAWNIDAGYRKEMEIGGVMEFYLEENGPVRVAFLSAAVSWIPFWNRKICFYPHTSRIDLRQRQTGMKASSFLEPPSLLIYRAVKQILKFSLEM